MATRRIEPDDLTKKYIEAGEQIMLGLGHDKVHSLPGLKKELEARIAEAVRALAKANRLFADETLAREYTQRAGGRPSAECNQLRKNVFVDLQTGLKGASEGLNGRIAAIMKAQSELGNATVFSATNTIREELLKGGVFQVTYSDGKQVPLASYAFMAARSARTETLNTANFDAARRNGSDLVKCTEIRPTCGICAQFQGRVYSISGRDDRFPALYETALKRGYKLIHPNCRHEFLPYFEELQSKEQVEKDIAFSNRPFDKDYRGKREREEYAEWQVRNRQVREERDEYLRWKEYYGGSLPYKTLGGFRRARRMQSSEYIKFQELYKKAHRKKLFSKTDRSEGNLTGGGKHGKMKLLPDHIPAKTVEEAEEYAQRFAEYVNYGATENVAAVDAVNQALTRIADRYPLQKLDTITFANLGDHTMAAYRYPGLLLSKRFVEDAARYQSGSTTRWKAVQEKRLKMYRDLLSENAGSVRQRQEWAKNVVELEKRNSFSRHNVIYEAYPIESVVTHEMGHVLADQMFGLGNGGLARKGYSENITNPDFQKVLKVKAAYNLARRRGDIQNISYYALKDEHEFFSECFTIHEFDEENLPEYIRKMIEEVLNG